MLGYEFFSNDRFGMGSTVSIATFVVAFAFTLVYVRVGRFREQVQT
jgi:ABC-type sugar transport system permease subunit